MQRLYRFLVKALDSWWPVALIVLFCIASFILGNWFGDMSVFASSGAVMTVFGLFSLIRFTTIEKYLNQDEIVQRSTGLTGKPVSQEEAERIKRENRTRAKVRLDKELRSELRGIALTVVGTLIWAYGAYIPVMPMFQWFA